MKKILIVGLLLITGHSIFAQKAEKVFNATEVERIEKVLASDEMRGRKVFTPEIDKAADFIAAEFDALDLNTLPGLKTFKQEFAMVRPKLISASAVMGGEEVDPKNLLVITSKESLKINESSGFSTSSIKAGENLFRKASSFVKDERNIIVFVDKSFASSFSRLSGLRRQLFKSDASIVFILSELLEVIPAKYSIESKHEITEQKLSNVVAVLPGKKKKDEYVIFSGHYDHIGVGKPVNGDSIFNGANDDAAGITAVIMLAKYFKALGNNERSIVFAAFTAEEVGGYGSQYFSRQFDPATVVAMFNIEMIGTESKWGKNSAFITGFEKTDMGEILQKNLEGSGFEFHPDPYPDQQLFYRSDNATLARLGVPAHTISTSKMDIEPNYHKVTDQVETLDLANMAMIIRAIAISSKTIVNGTDTPSRVKVEELR